MRSGAGFPQISELIWVEARSPETPDNLTKGMGFRAFGFRVSGGLTREPGRFRDDG